MWVNEVRRLEGERVGVGRKGRLEGGEMGECMGGEEG